MDLYGFSAYLCPDPTEVTGCLSYVNSYLSQEGLHRRNTLPPVIFDLYSPPPVHLEAEEGEEAMAYRRGRGVRKVKKKQPSQMEKLDQYKVPPPPPPSVSEVYSQLMVLITINFIVHILLAN